MDLSEAGQKLLSVLINYTRSGRLDVERPETYLGYGETLQLLNLPVDAPKGRTDGETLQLNGLNDLARWIKTRPSLPKFTGLIVSKSGSEKNTPGAGYFKEYNIPRNGKEYDWWLEESRKSLTFDWSPFIGSVELFDAEEIWNVGVVFEGKQSEISKKIRQRSQRLRELAREHFRSSDGKLYCAVCKWKQPDFELACEIIEIHHTNELSDFPTTGKKIPLNQALTFLAPLCPTCHRVLHAKPGGESFTVEELRELLHHERE